jgi:hypothetical protein
VTSSSVRRGLGALPLRPGPLKRCLSMLDALNGLGWGASARAKAPVGPDGEPLPWYTYPAILWLGPRLPADAAVFEYGAGNSTLWYAARCARVRSVDHDRTWVDAISARMPANVELLHRPTGGDDVEAPAGDEYVEAIGAPDAYDVVVIDGRARVACARRALPALRGDALAILDNADRPSLDPVLRLAAELGLARIDFTGPVPGSGRLSTTTVLGRELGRWLAAAPPLPHLGYDGS